MSKSKSQKDVFLHECVAFFYGRWTREAPTTPGTYRVADVHGVECSAIELRRVDGVLTHYRNGTYVPAKKAWRGLWWSMPNPNLPTARQQ